MGQHLMRRPPKYVQGFVDRWGKPRFYYRRPGFTRVALPGLPWSPEFMAAYEAALAGQPQIEPGKARHQPGTLNSVALRYMSSQTFKLLAANSQRNYRRAIERLCHRKDQNGQESRGCSASMSSS
jgi:hypothetical protein